MRWLISKFIATNVNDAINDDIDESTFDVIFACFRLILYVIVERHERFDEKVALKSIVKRVANCDINVDDEANELLTINFFKIWCVILKVEDRKLELFDVFD